MGKSKGKSSKGGKQSALPKCTCDHPYQCSCGNRPERPSKGHKWDPETQQWGGKGHKQKGASGQTASKALEDKTTAIGKTNISQWQKLPTQLLDEVTKKEGRPRAKYKSIGQYKFRVIVQDAKASRRGTEHDLILVPAKACGNEEQAKEEAALLALLYLTPNIPHERKLPEPYRTTWLYAVKASKEKNPKNSKNQKDKSKERIETNTQRLSDSTNSGAKASTNLKMGNSFVSLAEKRKQKDKERQERKSRIQKHEAIRLANKDHQVFLSAQMRKRIETLLRGEVIDWNDEANNHDDDEDDLDDDLKVYVVKRLQSEGFTKLQSKTSISKIERTKLKSCDAEEKWDEIYDECLQWLCIHLDEDQLPEGFDPRGRTLDVIVAKDTKSTEKAESEEAIQLASRFGLKVSEASTIIEKAGNDDIEDILWNELCLKSASSFTKSSSIPQSEENEIVAREEIEALQAIFVPDELNIQQTNEITKVTITIPSEIESEKNQLEIITHNGIYPAAHVDRVLISGTWSKKHGVTVHCKLIQFMSELELSEPMIFELYGKAQSLLQESADGSLSIMSLSMSNKENVPSSNSHMQKKASVVEKINHKPKRPRPNSPFWTVSPSKTPKADESPKVDISISKQRGSLPAAKIKSDFLKLMKECNATGRVVLITGDTGCGKTTQIPQFILENSPNESKIVVAQPRRLAATGVANRVANERGESQAGVGSVGYVVRGDVAVCKDTRLLFCTTGVLLRQLQSEKALDCITHIIVDEVHERHLDTDVLLGILKSCIKKTPHIKVILMSATLDANRFAAYWGPKTPRMHIPGRTFPVTDYMLEDVLALTGYIPPKKGKKKQRFYHDSNRTKNSSPWNDSEISDKEDEEDTNIDYSKPGIGGKPEKREHNIPMEELLKRVNEATIDYDMLGQLVKYLIQTKRDNGSILVFMTGAPEINNGIKTIEKITRSMNIELLPLHGGLQPKDQNLVFRPARYGFTKVILSTNVAETSITIPDCTVVIDCCREKQSSYDPVNRMPLLLERFAAKANLKQRRGRAGRVQSGDCYKLISKATYDKLPDHGTPEIHRCALDQTFLSLLFLGVEQGSGNFLQTLLDSPSKSALDAAILSLQKLGAISPRDANGMIELTPLGMHLAGIPAPPTVGKMLVMGSILGCRSAALAMAAGMSAGRSPFVRISNFPGQIDEESEEDIKRRKVLEEREELFKTVGNSDHAMFAAAYLNWDSYLGAERRKYCDLMGLSIPGMRDVKQLVKQLDSSLSTAGYKPSVDSNRNAKSWRTIRACVVAALAPSQLVRVLRPSAKYAETLGGAKEKDGEARELKFFIQVDADLSPAKQNGSDNLVNVNRRYHDIAEERVFMHPSSANFSTGNFSCPWLVYNELVRTSKPYLRDATECSAYALLLFGGGLQVQAGNGTIVIANYIRLAANARIGALIGGLRKTIDQLLQRKIQDPKFDITVTTEMKLVNTLLVTDGLGF